MKKIYLAIYLLCLPSAIVAQNGAEGELDAAPLPPDIPAPLQSGEPIEPDVTIIRKEDSMVEEYRINGNLYMVKITPAAGPAYYLIDRDGDGSMEWRTSTLGSDVVVPQWVLFSW
jgi:hypothetical protein